MEINGKCKEKFQEYFKTKLLEQADYSKFLPSHIELFNSYPEEMRGGVLVDFFDSLGLEIFITLSTPPFNKEKYMWGFGISEDNYCWGNSKTRREALKTAIKKANEIANEQLNA